MTTPEEKISLKSKRPLSVLRRLLCAVLLSRPLIVSWLVGIGLVLLVALPRLTALNRYVIVDEADRWRWAEDFVNALSQGDLAGTRIGDGYPGITPVWAESAWIFFEATRRSLVEGKWIGQAGLYMIFHEWDRSDYLFQQRLPIVLLNTILVLAIIWAIKRLFGGRVALVGAVLLALDPFYLSDSRVNRAEAVIAGLMTLSILSLIFYHRQQRLRRYVLLSGLFGGLSFLTKIQALAILPTVGLVGLLVEGLPLLPPSVAKEEEKRLPSVLPTVAKEGEESFSSIAKKTAKGWREIIPGSAHRFSFFLFLAIWAAAATLVWFLLWPAMWVTPLETLALVYNYTTRKVGAEGVNLFFMGRTYADADPGPIFYPFVFLMRITPLALFGLIFYVLAAYRRYEQRAQGPMLLMALKRFIPSSSGSFILVIFVLVYALVMTLGSHKQDRYLLPIFPGLDILAAIGLVTAWDWLRSRLSPSAWIEGVLGVGLLTAQLITILPHHPYYYSYFNPLLGDGSTAVRTMRVGWGEGMDQVGAYLAAKPNSRRLIVSSRFTHNMPDFKGESISLLPDGRWTQADYIVLYIQQVQRRQEPGPGFIDYFQARTPEKVITIGGIDYAWIYPIPFTVSANPQLSLIPNQAALLGYSWETKRRDNEGRSDALPFSLRVFWENLGLDAGRQLLIRLVGPAGRQTEWTVCSPDPAFVAQTQTPGAFIESLCAPPLTGLPSGTYTVEFSLDGETFLFPEGRYAATLTPDGGVVDTPELERLQAISNEAIPADTLPLDRIYEGYLKLAAYRLDPPTPRPGEEVKLDLYWQAIKEVKGPARLTVQLADSRSLSLGRVDADLPADKWLLGEVKLTRQTFSLAPNLESPLAGQIEIELRNQAEVTLRPTTLAGGPLEARAARFTVAPKEWPVLTSTLSSAAVWQQGLSLRGYRLSPQPAQPGQTLSLSLFWQAGQPITENYAVFVHLLDNTGQIIAQNDALPRSGAYPTPWWLPGLTVEDTHSLTLPPGLPDGTYQWVVGLYRAEDGARLPLVKGGDSFELGTIKVKAGE